MATIFDLLKEEEKKIKKANKIRVGLAELKRLRELDEADIWLSTDFKALGATNDKLRSAIVTQKLNQFPNTYEQKKAKLIALENEVKYIRDVIDAMKEFGVDEIELEEKDKDEEPSDPASQ